MCISYSFHSPFPLQLLISVCTFIFQMRAASVTKKLKVKTKETETIDSPVNDHSNHSNHSRPKPMEAEHATANAPHEDVANLFLPPNIKIWAMPVDSQEETAIPTHHQCDLTAKARPHHSWDSWEGGQMKGMASKCCCKKEKEGKVFWKLFLILWPAVHWINSHIKLMSKMSTKLLITSFHNWP